MGKTFYRNLPNIASILGVLPIGLLLLPNGYQFLIPLIIYNNLMDDLDGVLAARLNLKSGFGAVLDNVCDAVTHTLFVLAVGVHFGGLCAVASVGATIGIILRVVSRLEAPPVVPRGSPTNEVIRHLLFVLILGEIFDFNMAAAFAAVFAIHGVAMLVPFQMTQMIRSRARSAAAVGAVNLALILAWVVPVTAAPIAAAFMLTFLYSFTMGGYRWLGREQRERGLAPVASGSSTRAASPSVDQTTPETSLVRD